MTAALLLAGGSISAQDVALTNAKLERPGMMKTYGSACFTLIAEDGLAVTIKPLAVEVTLSKVEFDLAGIEGFNSEFFYWEQDPFADNVIKGTLINNIPSIDNDGGGAQICIPVKRNNANQYRDARNGFQVNVVPGSVIQGGNSGTDETSRFGFSSGVFSAQNSGITANKEHENVAVKWEVEAYDESKYFEIQRSLDGITFETIATVEANKNPFDGGQYSFLDDQISEELSKTAFYKVKSILNDGQGRDSEVRSVDFEMSYVSIYPNPTSDRFTVSTMLKGSANQLSIYNANGTLVSQNSNVSNGSQIDVKNLTPGVYHLQFQNKEGDKTENKRLLVIN